MSHMSPQDTPRHLPTGPPPDGSPLRARATPTSARYASAASPSAAAPSPSRVPPLPKTGLAALVERFGSIQVEIDGNLLNLHLAPFGFGFAGVRLCGLLVPHGARARRGTNQPTGAGDFASNFRAALQAVA